RGRRFGTGKGQGVSSTSTGHRPAPPTGLRYRDHYSYISCISYTSYRTKRGRVTSSDGAGVRRGLAGARPGRWRRRRRRWPAGGSREVAGKRKGSRSRAFLELEGGSGGVVCDLCFSVHGRKGTGGQR